MKIKKKEKRDKDLEALFAKEEQTLLSIFSTNVNGVTNLLKTIHEIIKQWIELTETEKKKNATDLEKEENEEAKEVINKRRDPLEIFKKMNKFMEDFVHFKSFFFDYLHIYATAFASMTGTPNQATTSAISNRIIEVIKLYSDLRHLKSEDLLFKADDSSYPLEQYLQTNLITLLVGFISKIAGTLIRVKKVEPAVKTEEKKEEKTETEEEKL